MTSKNVADFVQFVTLASVNGQNRAKFHLPELAQNHSVFRLV
jgi:hypothetical protein